MYSWILYQLYANYNNRPAIEALPNFHTFSDPHEDLINLERQINQLIGIQLSDFQEESDFQVFIERCTDLGFTTQNAYLFIRGHDLLEKVTLKLLKWVAQPIVEREFSNLNNEDKAIYYDYQKLNSFEKLLYQNTNFDNCSFYMRMIEDIRRDFG